jgi:hypothetical protein
MKIQFIDVTFYGFSFSGSHFQIDAGRGLQLRPSHFMVLVLAVLVSKPKRSETGCKPIPAYCFVL